MEYAHECPHCHFMLISNQEPRFMDYTVCPECKEVLVFSETLDLQPVSETELQQLMYDAPVVWKELIKLKNK